MRRLLAYNLSGEKEREIRLLCEEAQIVYTAVPAVWYGRPVGALAGMEGLAETDGLPPASPFSDEMLVFVGFTDDALGRFLSLYREAGIEPVWLKAVLTPHNVGWDAFRLHGELVEEYEAIRKEKEE